ncbi:MAG: phage tail protein [Chloroflexi bacterium]|nr:phage tail protein [Chloroflexota bacterium]
MPLFTVNTHRFDPYKNYMFRVWWDGRPVAGISKVSALKRTTEVVSHREGGDFSTPRHSPAGSKYEAVTLERGVTWDLEFEAWANKVYDVSAGVVSSLESFRKDVTIQLMNEAGQVVMAYTLFRCWVSEYQAMAELDANANAVLIQSIVLQNEGWQRDESVTEPKEP